MYCKNCGSKLNDDALFCNICGSEVQKGNNVVSVGNYQPVQNHHISNREIERLSELNELNNMIVYFSQKLDVYKDYDNCSKELYILKRGNGYAPLIWGVILSVLSFFDFCGVIAYQPGNTHPLAFRFYLISFILLSIVSTGLIIWFIIKSIRYGSRLKIITEKCNALENELWDHYEKYGYCLVGFEYSNPANLAVIKQTINAGRADNTREAINILLDDAHKANMEAIAIQTARSAAKAARGSTTAAIFSAGSFFFK